MELQSSGPLHPELGGPCSSAGHGGSVGQETGITPAPITQNWPLWQVDGSVSSSLDGDKNGASLSSYRKGSPKAPRSAVHMADAPHHGSGAPAWGGGSAELGVLTSGSWLLKGENETARLGELEKGGVAPGTSLTHTGHLEQRGPRESRRPASCRTQGSTCAHMHTHAHARTHSLQHNSLLGERRIRRTREAPTPRHTEPGAGIETGRPRGTEWGRETGRLPRHARRHPRRSLNRKRDGLGGQEA